jgi:flagellar L-ring protein precursor FlgH
MSIRLALIAPLSCIGAALTLGACTTVSETVHGPQLSAVAYPAQLMPVQQEIAHPRGPQSANTLWRTGARAFFKDQRANKVGDILTVAIDINDNASISNDTATSRETSVDGGVSKFFGLESTLAKVLPGSPDTGHLVTSGSTTSMAGSGSVNRSEAVSLTIAAVVSAVLPNGNMMIQGRQEVRINQELRELTIAGIVRPEDITAANTIRHTQIAEARVSYGGRGAISRVQKVPAGQALLEKFTPF